MIHDRQVNLKYNHGNRVFGSKGYAVSIVGANEKMINRYIQEQEADGRLREHMTKRE